MDDIYFEDVSVRATLRAGPHVIAEQKPVALA
jgi:hypothetical protein